jgi:hypothetical protein
MLCCEITEDLALLKNAGLPTAGIPTAFGKHWDWPRTF